MNISNNKNAFIRITVALILTAAAILILIFGIINRQNGPEITIGNDFIRVLDVGQGDSILVSSNGKHLLIDTGTPSGAEDLCKKLRAYGVKTIDVLLLTHFHTDHAGGIEAITNCFKVKKLLYPDMEKSDQLDISAINAKKNVEKQQGVISEICANNSFTLGDFEITILCYYNYLEDENNRSAATMITLGESDFLLMADIEKEAEKLLLKEDLDLDCEVLKVGHHGSSSSTGEKLLKECSPETAVISCGAGNSYSHPHDETLFALEKCKAQVYRTDLQGDILFTVFPLDIEIECERPLK